MGTKALRRYKRIRLIVGGALFFLGCLFLLPWYPLWAFVSIICGFVSSVRAVLNGSFAAGFLLTKITGISILLFPFLMLAGEKCREDLARWDTSVKNSDPRPHDEETKAHHIPDVVVQIPETAPPPLVHSEKNEIKATSPKAVEEPVPDLSNLYTFIEYYRLAEQGSDIDLVMTQYAPFVDYFGKGFTKARVQSDKVEYWEKWPVRSEKITTPFKVKPSDIDEWLVFFDSTFKNRNPETGAWIEGVLSSGYTLKQHGETYRVTRQSATVLEVQKGTVTSSNPAPTKPERKHESPSKVALNLIKRLRVAEQRRDLDSVMRCYSDRIKYFGSSKSKGAVRKDKAGYFTKWPTAQDELLSDYSVKLQSPNLVRVTYRSRFTMTSPHTASKRSGIIDHRFLVAVKNGTATIKAQSGKVSKIKTSNPPKK